MKYPEITFQTVLGAIRHQWKVLLLSLILFALIGVGAGFAFSEKAAAPAAGSADPLEPVSYDEIYYDGEYYSSCKEYLFQKYANALSYVKDMAGEKTLTAEQAALLEECRLRLLYYRTTELLPIRSAWETTDAVYIPEEFIATETARYESLLSGIRRDLVEAEAAVDLLKSMDAPNISDDTISSAYGELLTKASQYGTLQTSAMRYESILDQLQNHPDTAISNGRWMEIQLNSALDTLNRLQTEIDEVMNQIATENHLYIHPGYENDEFQLTIDHTHSLASSQEAFAILVIFCCLTGACLGLFLAVCREAKHGKKSLSRPEYQREDLP